jgi:hypothetical protein
MHGPPLFADPATEARANAQGQGREGIARNTHRSHRSSQPAGLSDYQYAVASLPQIAGGALGGAAAPVRDGQGPAASPPAQAAPVVPFPQASHRGIEEGPTIVKTPAAAAQQEGPIPIPAQGFLRSLLLTITPSGGVAGEAEVAGDFPWNCLNLVRLQDTNGAPLCELSGYNLMLMNTYGGFSGCPDPRNDPDFTKTVVAPSFAVRIPVEIAPTGLGSLANQSSSASYKLTIIVASQTEIWKKITGITAPALTIKTFCEFWTLPAAMDMLNRKQQRTPPFHGTAQYFTQQMNNSLNKGQNGTKISRVGSLIRTLAFVTRASGIRTNAVFPDPWTMNWDSRLLQVASARVLRKWMREYVSQLSERDTGVYVWGFSFGQQRLFGANEINSWLPTVTATRLELVGSSEEAGTIDVVVNDVSVAETNPAARAVETSLTGFAPPVAPTVGAAQ